MSKIKKLLEELDYYDLMLLKKDLDRGGFAIKKLVENNIRHKIQESDKFCTICGKKIDSNNAYVLIFGPADFRKKASFCSLECLEFFIKGLKKQKIKQ